MKLKRKHDVNNNLQETTTNDKYANGTNYIYVRNNLIYHKCTPSKPQRRYTNLS